MGKCAYHIYIVFSSLLGKKCFKFVFCWFLFFYYLRLLLVVISNVSCVREV